MGSCRCVLLVGVVWLLLIDHPLRGQERAGVGDAIKKGIVYLRKEQSDEGTWEFKNHRVGITALAALSLVESRVPLSDAYIRKAYYYVRENCREEEQTYDVALSILLLSRVGERRDRVLIRSLARRLMVGQLDSGGWTYRLRKEGRGAGDNSNTQFAVLGLWVASRSGVKVDDALDRVEDRFRSTQVATGGWGYQPTKPSESPAMSFAGLFALAVAEAADLRRQNEQAEVPSADAAKPKEAAPQIAAGVAPGKTLIDDAAFRKGLQRAGAIIARPIDFKSPNPAHLPYFLWSVERLGVLLGVRQFGETDWYEKGSEALLKSQRENGSWNWESRVIGGPVANTCFALLFLRRANLGSDVTRLLKGDPKEPFVIVARDGQEARRFLTLKEAVDAALEEDVIDVEGPGPFETDHQLIEKSLTVRAAKGYEPIFRFALGRSDTGVPRDPVADASARYLLNVREASVVLEGLRLQMDPPMRLGVQWGMVALSNASLKAVNCVFSRTSRIGVDGVSGRGTQAVELRNCLCAGLDAAVNLTAEVEHQVTLENCLVFGGTVVKLQSGRQAAAHAARVVLRNNTMQAEELLNLEQMAGDVRVRADGNAMQLHWVCSSLELRNGRRVEWDGGDSQEGAPNLYDVRRWLGRQGRSIREVRDLQTWRRYWRTDEAGSVHRPVPFVSRRPLSSYRHNLSPLDWRIARGIIGESDYAFGADLFLVGTGTAYVAANDGLEAAPRGGERLP